MLTTTLNAIRACDPCPEGWRTLLSHLGKTEADDEPLPFSVIVESNGLEDALWACRSAPQYDREWRLFAVWCARQVQRLMADPRSVAVLDVSEKHANGQATDAELAAAWATAGAARVAADVAWATARAAARDAARDAARVAARDAARDAARSAAWDAAWAAARSAEKIEFLRVVSGEAK